MGFKCGIVGLPNVGKSTIFNALTSNQIAAENYPFCTIEPNIGIVEVPDSRIHTISSIAKSAKTIPAHTQFVDIAGLVAGAANGEGLGNKFLANIRETDAIAQVVRCFEDNDITHVYNQVNPLHDIDIINTELVLADMERCEKLLSKNSKLAKAQDKTAKANIEILQIANATLEAGKMLRAHLDASILSALEQFQFLSAKPIMYIANTGEEQSHNQHTQAISEFAIAQQAPCVLVSAKIEAELAQLDASAKQELLTYLEMDTPGLNKVIQTGYAELGLETFFTAGPKEARAWSFPKGAKAPEAAGRIHTDFTKGFIKAEVIAYDDYVACNGEQGAKEAGKLRIEGKEYIFQDGDVALFRFNV